MRIVPFESGSDCQGMPLLPNSPQKMCLNLIWTVLKALQKQEFTTHWKISVKRASCDPWVVLVNDISDSTGLLLETYTLVPNGTFTPENSAEKRCGFGCRNSKSGGERDWSDTNSSVGKTAFVCRKPIKAQHIVGLSDYGVGVFASSSFEGMSTSIGGQGDPFVNSTLTSRGEHYLINCTM